MPIHNADIEKLFNDVADLLEIDGANEFRVRAYRNAARAVASMSGSAAEMLENGEDLTAISGIGDDLAGKIETIVKTGSLPLLEKMENRVPPGLRDVLDVSGLGPRKTASLYKELGVEDVASLRKAAERQQIRELDGFGPKTEQNILDDLQRHKGGPARIKLAKVEEYAGSLVRHLQQVKELERIVVAGSYRRRKETVGDLDILVTCKDSAPVMEAFTGFEDVRKVVSRGDTRSTVILRSGLQVDLRVVRAKSYGAALHYFTGSKAHNIAVRKLGLERGYKINEYGVFTEEDADNDDAAPVAGETEQEVYDIVGLAYIEPELREDRGEIKAAAEGALPELVTVEHVKGDLHTHTKATDGSDSLEDMAQAASQRGYEYLAITDHSRSQTVSSGLDPERLREQIEAIDTYNQGQDDIVVLKGIEVDILEDGSLDLPDDVLEKLDIRICSVHAHFDLSQKKQTERIIRAMDNPLCNVIAHPTARLIHERGALALDMEKIMQAAKERGVLLECNAQPERLDLDDVHLKAARDIGCWLSIATDAHWTEHLANIRFGVDQARRGWIEPASVANALPLAELRKLLAR